MLFVSQYDCVSRFAEIPEICINVSGCMSGMSTLRGLNVESRPTDTDLRKEFIKDVLHARVLNQQYSVKRDLHRIVLRSSSFAPPMQFPSLFRGLVFSAFADGAKQPNLRSTVTLTS